MEKRARTKATSGAVVRPVLPGWRWKTIGMSGLIVGAIGGAVGLWLKGSALNNIAPSVGLAMFMAPYFVVPRTKTNRILQGLISGVISGIVSTSVLFVFDTSRYWPLRTELLITAVEFLLMAVVVSWSMSFMTDWADKRRAKQEVKASADKPVSNIVRGAGHLPAHGRTRKKRRKRR